jgi:hypothetical protein
MSDWKRKKKDDQSIVEQQLKFLRCFYQSVDDMCSESRRSHSRRKSDEHVNFLIKLRMNAEGRERLCSALTETDIAYISSLGGINNILNSVRNVVPGEIIQAVIPEFLRVRTMMDRLFRVLVTAVIPKPYIETYNVE